MDLFLIEIPKNENKIENSKKQSEFSKYFVEFLGRNFYKKDFILRKEKSGKPFLEGLDYNISIAHSNSIIAILISKQIIGVDIEYIKKRDFKKILARFKVKKDNPNQTDFYAFWTKYEAEFKSGIKNNTLNFEYNNYMVAISSAAKAKPNIYAADYSIVAREKDINNQTWYETVEFSGISSS